MSLQGTSLFLSLPRHETAMVVMGSIILRRRAFSWPRAEHCVSAVYSLLCHRRFDGTTEKAMSSTAWQDPCVVRTEARSGNIGLDPPHQHAVDVSIEMPI